MGPCDLLTGPGEVNRGARKAKRLQDEGYGLWYIAEQKGRWVNASLATSGRGNNNTPKCEENRRCECTCLIDKRPRRHRLSVMESNAKSRVAASDPMNKGPYLASWIKNGFQVPTVHSNHGSPMSSSTLSEEVAALAWYLAPLGGASSPVKEAVLAGQGSPG